MIDGWVTTDVGSEPAAAPLPEPHVASFREGDTGAMTNPEQQTHEGLEVGGGSVDVNLGQTSAAYETLLAELTVDQAFYVALIDGFAGQGSLAPAPSRLQGFMFGDDSLHLFGYPHTENGLPVIAPIRPREIAPAGFMGEVILKNLYLSITTSTHAVIDVTPIIDGRRLETQQITVTVPEVGKKVSVVREVPLSEAFVANGIEYARVNPRGTWFTFEALAQDTFGGQLSINGAKLDWDPVRESRPGVVYSAEVVGSPAVIPPPRLFLGDSGVLQYMGGDDDGTPYDALVRPAEVGFKDADVESWFRTLYVVLMRQNTEEVTATITPLLDGEALEQDVRTLDPVSGVVIEVLEVPLSIPLIADTVEVGRYGARGRWFTAEAQAPSKDVSFLGMYVDFDPVRESL